MINFGKVMMFICLQHAAVLFSHEEYRPARDQYFKNTKTPWQPGGMGHY